MCRLMVYLGDPIVVADLVTRPSHSVMKQSYAARERLTGGAGYIPLSINADGCGIGWYAPEVERKDGDPTPGIYTSISPAWNDANLERIAPKILSPLIFAHVRAAMVGSPVTQMKCHPFTVGRYLWMHNGEIGAFRSLCLPLLNSLRPEVAELCPCFESDTAVAFAVFLDQLEDPMAQLAPTALAPLMAKTIKHIRKVAIENGKGDETSMLNFVVSDGRTVVAARYTNDSKEDPASLHYATGSAFTRKGKDSPDYKLEYWEKRTRLGLVASEPLTDEAADWTTVPPNHMVVLMHSEGSFVDTLVLPIEEETEQVKDHVTRCYKALDQSIADNAPQARAVAPGAGLRSPNLPANLAQGDLPVVKAPEKVIDGAGESALAVAADATRAFVGTQDGTIKVFDLKTGKLLHTLNDHSHAVFSIVASKERLYTSSMRVVNEWDLTSSPLRLLSTCHHSNGDVLALAAGKDIPIGGPKDVKIHKEVADENGATKNSEADWLAKEGEPVRARALLTDVLGGGHVSTVYAVIVLGNTLCSAAGDASVKVWDLETGRCTASLYGHTGAVLALASAPKTSSKGAAYYVLSGGRDNTVRVWDPDTWECVQILKGHSDDVMALCGAEGDRFYSASSDGTVRAWDAATWKGVQVFLHEDTIPLSIWATETGVISGTADGKLHCWKLDEAASK